MPENYTQVVSGTAEIRMRYFAVTTDKRYGLRELTALDFVLIQSNATGV